MEGRFVRQSFQQYHKRTSPHHESLKNHCDSEQSVKFEKYGWKNAVLSAYLMRGVFLQPSVMSPILLALIILHLFDETT